jgi:predicted nucleic acid-binding protein
VHVIERFKQHQLGDIAISSITAAVLAFGIEKSGSVRNRLAHFEVAIAKYATTCKKHTGCHCE